MQRFKNIKENGKHISFDICDVDVSIVNSIRRVIFTDIPSVGFYFKLKDHFVDNDIVIEKNDSPIHNEFLAHRLSMIPLHLNEEEIDNWDSNQYTFVLEKKNVSGSIVDVTTKDFEIYDKDGKELQKSFRDRVFPPNPITKDHILITKLQPNLDNIEKGSHIKLKAIAKKGIAKDCICWSIVSQCCYFNSLDQKIIDSHLKKITKDMSKDEKETTIKEFDTLEKYRYFKKDKYGDPNQFTFSLESECELSPKYIFYKACLIIASMLENIMIELSKDEDSKLISVNVLSDVSNFFTVSIKGYTHTIGNLLQSMMLNKYVRDKVDKDYDLDYVGYSVPHPLEEMFVLKLKFNNDITRRKLIDFMIKSCNDTKTLMLHLSSEWYANK